MTNPALQNMVKIGYATHVEARRPPIGFFAGGLKAGDELVYVEF